MTQTKGRPTWSLDLTDAARRYLEDGALFVGPVLTPEELTEIRAHLRRFNQHVVPNLPESIRAKTIRVEKEGTELRSCYFMDQIDEWFNAFGNRADFKELIRAVTGWEPELYVVETFNKAAKVGSAVPPHQDCAFLPLDPMDVAHLWIAIDDATAENGALRYWMGSHSHGLLSHVPAQWGLAMDPALVDLEDPRMVVMEVPAGSAAIHSGLIVHDSPPNVSDRSRMGLLCGYRGAHTTYLRDDGNA